jgi:hypothetical protein
MNWNPNKFDETFENVAIERLVQAAEVVATKARQNCHEGTITRPVYKSGKYAGRAWTSREPGRLKKSIRVRRKRTVSGRAFSRKRNIRIYAGNVLKGGMTYGDYLAYYGAIVEFKRPYLRPAFWSSVPEIKRITGAK